MNISITGNLGSGKSSICRILKEQGFEIVSAGTIFRELAVEQGMSVEAFNQKVNEDIKRGDHSVDDLIDQRTTRINQERDNVIFDSRLAWNFAPDSFKVFVTVDIDEAARRVYHDSLRSDSETYESQETCRQGLINRQNLEKQRFRDLYSVDYYNMSNYNLVIESTNAKPADVAEEIIKKFAAYQKNMFAQCVELNPVSIYPTGNVDKLSYDRIMEVRKKIKGNELCGRIEVGLAGDNWFVKTGHNRLLAALLEQSPFVSVAVDNGFRPAILTEEEYHKFEQSGSFEYKRYPAETALSRESLLSFSVSTI